VDLALAPPLVLAADIEAAVGDLGRVGRVRPDVPGGDLLGGDPLLALGSAARRLRPRAIFLWAQLTGPMNTEFVTGVEEFRGGASVLLGGPGWEGAVLPNGMQRARSLDDAIRLLSG